jgi:hypothetical protein
MQERLARDRLQGPRDRALAHAADPVEKNDPRRPVQGPPSASSDDVASIPFPATVGIG